MASNQLAGGGGGGEDDGEDRISQLPDEIIHTILRSLESPDAAARTSVLSRRWLQLWRRYPFFEFERSESSESQFRSFVDSSSRKLLPPPPPPPPPPDSDSDSNHNNCASVEAIRDFRIALQDGDFRKEDLDRLLLLLIGNANGLSPDKFALSIWYKIDLHSFYSLEVIQNWSRMKIITLHGCHLAFGTTPIFGIHGNHDSGAVSLGSLESLELNNVNVGEELLHDFLVNAPRLVSLSLINIYGIDRLEVVSSPRLKILCLERIYRFERWYDLEYNSDYNFEKMRKLRILSPKLESLSMRLNELDELVIDAPNLVSIAWNVRHGVRIAKVEVISLKSTCQFTINLLLWVGCEFTSTSLRLFLSTMLTQFHHLNLMVSPYFTSSRQYFLRLSKYASPPPKIDQLQLGEIFRKIHDISEAAALIDGLFWTCLPKFVSITHNEKNDLIAEYMCRMYLKSDDTSNGMHVVATSSSWSLHLQDMKVENEITGKMMEISEDMIQSLAKQKKVRFVLIWD